MWTVKGKRGVIQKATVLIKPYLVINHEEGMGDKKFKNMSTWFMDGPIGHCP